MHICAVICVPTFVYANITALCTNQAFMCTNQFKLVAHANTQFTYTTAVNARTKYTWALFYGTSSQTVVCRCQWSTEETMES